MNTTKMNSAKSELDKEIERANQKLRLTKCQCCNRSPYKDNFGEWYQGQWWCFNHVEILLAKQGVADLHGLMAKG